MAYMSMLERNHDMISSSFTKCHSVQDCKVDSRVSLISFFPSCICCQVFQPFPMVALVLESEQNLASLVFKRRHEADNAHSVANRNGKRRLAGTDVGDNDQFFRHP